MCPHLLRGSQETITARELANQSIIAGVHLGDAEEAPYVPTIPYIPKAAKALFMRLQAWAFSSCICLSPPEEC